MRIFNSRLLSETAVNCGIVMLMTVGIFSVVKVLAFLRRAVQGNLPVDGLGMILTFKLATFLDVILTPTVYIAIMLMLMRWSRDNEMVIFATGGVGPLDYLKPASAVAAIAAFVVAMLSFFVTPAAELGYQHELDKFRLTTKSAPYEKGQFRRLDTEHDVLYFSPRPDDEYDPLRLFYVQSDGNTKSIIVAENGSYEFDLSNAVENVNVASGAQYWIDFDSLAFQETDFHSYIERVPATTLADSPLHVKAKPTLQLIRSDSPQDGAELHWRMSKVLSMALVVMLAFSWGIAASRSRSSINIVGAVLVYFVYSSLVGFLADQLRQGEVSPGFLSALPHLLILMLIVALLVRSYYNRAFVIVRASKRV